jgi:hypothetical protein
MRLWTWHTPDFSLLEGSVDHSRSVYFQTHPGVPAAYRELAKRLGTDQLVWCYTAPNQHHYIASDNKVEWELDVPDGEIVALIDAVAWSRIIGQNLAITRELSDRWHAEAKALHPTDEAAQRAHEKERLRQSAVPPPGGWWSVVFVHDRTGEGVSALVRHLVPKSWIVKSPPNAAIAD